MLAKLRQALLFLTAQGESRDLLRRVRILAAGAVRNAHRLPQMIEGIGSREEMHRTEPSTWVAPKALADGIGGRFDACDLRHWLALADRAGIDYVPARPILTLSQAEAGAACGSIELDGSVFRRLRQILTKLLPAEASQICDGSPRSSTSVHVQPRRSTPASEHFPWLVWPNGMLGAPSIFHLRGMPRVRYQR